MVYSVADFRGDVARLAKALTEPLRDSVRAHPQSCRPLRFSVAWRRSAHPRDAKDAWARLEEAFGCCVKFPFSVLVTWLFPALCGPLSGCADIASVALDGLYRIFVYVAIMAPLSQQAARGCTVQAPTVMTWRCSRRSRRRRRAARSRPRARYRRQAQQQQHVVRQKNH